MVACEQSWAGRFVIGLQLLSWCAVGAILLHRGFSSIQLQVRKPTNDTADSYPLQTNLSDLIDADSLGDKSISNISHTQQIVAKSTLTGKQVKTSIQDILSNKLEKQTGNVHSSSTSDANPDGNLPSSNFPGESLDSDLETLTNESGSSKVQVISSKTPVNVHNVRVPPFAASAKKKYDLTPSGLVMVALGAIMLVVGPSVVILRCCDSGSQGRRFNKLSADDPALALANLDLPPAYEEVAGRAPRYSMIFPDHDEEEIRQA